MDVLFLAPQPFFTERGTPIAVAAAVRALAADGHRVDVLTYHEGTDINLPGASRILRIPRPPFVRRVPIGPSWQKAVCDLFLLRAAWRAIRTGGARRGGPRRPQYDVVHAVEEAAFIAQLLRRRLGVPYIYDMDSLMSEQIAERSRLFRPVAAAFSRWERRAVRESLGVLAVCPALSDFANAHHPDRRVALLPDTPLDNVAGAPPHPDLAGMSRPRLVYVGNLEPYQGVDLMVRAFADIAREDPLPTLVIVGGNKRSMSAMRAIAPELCESGRIRLLGPRPLGQLGSILAAADILVSPRCAGRNTPMKLYSYLASGRPIIATRLSTHTQVLDESTAVLVEPSPEGLAAGMRRLVESPDLRRAIGVRGRELVEREYSQKMFRARIREFYRIVSRLIEKPPSPASYAGSPTQSTVV